MARATTEDQKACAVPWEHVRIPPFSQVALRVLQLAAQENMQLSQLSALISADPAFAGEVLMIVNSLVYAPRFPISSILQAIAVMGATHLQGVCLAVGVRGFLGASLSDPAVRALWRHNLACATIAEQIASAGFIDRDVAFSCGVLHDIGRMALAVVMRKEYVELLNTHRGPAESLLDQERAVFGKDDCEIGMQLVKDWKLPAEFEPIVAHHHEPVASDAAWGMLRLVHVSCQMADAAGFAAFPGCEVQPFEEMLAEVPARERRLFYRDTESLQTEIGRKILAIEAI